MGMNGVIETATGDLIRAGLCDFSQDGSFDDVTEDYRNDVPVPPKVRGDKNNDKHHRWNGSSWDEVDQPEEDEMRASDGVGGKVTLSGSGTTEVVIYEKLVNVTRAVRSHKLAIGRVSGIHKTSEGGSPPKGAQIQIYQSMVQADYSIGSRSALLSTPYPLPDTGGVFRVFDGKTDLEMNPGPSLIEVAVTGLDALTTWEMRAVVAQLAEKKRS